MRIKLFFICKLILLFISVACLLCLKLVYLRPPFYYDVSGWLSWIWLVIFIVLSSIVPFAKTIYWYLALIIVSLGAFFLFFQHPLYEWGEQFISFGFVLFVACIILGFSKYLKKNSNYGIRDNKR